MGDLRPKKQKVVGDGRHISFIIQIIVVKAGASQPASVMPVSVARPAALLSTRRIPCSMLNLRYTQEKINLSSYTDMELLSIRNNLE